MLAATIRRLKECLVTRCDLFSYGLFEGAVTVTFDCSSSSISSISSRSSSSRSERLCLKGWRGTE